MKKLMTLLLCCAMTFAIPQVASAFEKAKTKISTVKQKGNEVVFTLTSSKRFIVGGNDYILFIGNKHFEENRNLSIDGKGIMTFIISKEDFGKLTDGDGIYLTYGHMTRDEEHEGEEMAELCRQNNKRVWSLGKFSSKMLTK